MISKREELPVLEIQNFSPSFDKRTPTVMEVPEEKVMYLGLRKESNSMRISERDIFSSMFGGISY